MAMNIKEVLKTLVSSLKKYTDDAIVNKVDKKEGYSLIADSEIDRLKNVDNYDDTKLKALVDRKIEFIPAEFINETELETILSDYTKSSELTAKNYVKTVNNIVPDTNGNVIVTTTMEPPTVVDSIEEMTDTSKQYVLSTDGFIYGYTKIEQEEVWIDYLSQVGWNEKHRINSSGAIVAYNSKPSDTTNYIPCKIGDVIKLENITVPSAYTSGAYHNTIGVYDANKTCLEQHNICDQADDSKELDIVIVDGNVVEFTLKEGLVNSNVAYIAINAQDINENSKVLIKGIPKTRIPNFKNLADPTSTDWLNDTRLSTSGTSAQTGCYVTNYIPCKKDDIVRIKGMTTSVSQAQKSRIHILNSNKELVTTDTGYMYELIDAGKATYTENLLTFTAGYTGVGGQFSNTAYIRYAGTLVDGYTVDDVIITVNEEITYTESETQDTYGWVSTGLSFVANDYSGVIAEMQQDIGILEQRVSKLATTSSGSSIPSYWTSELETKADLIQQAVEVAGRNKSAFLWYTDAHWLNNAKKSPMILEYMIDNTSINKVNFGGDIITDHNPWVHDAVKYAYEWKQMISKIPNHHSVYGNHDVNHRTTDVSKIAYSLVLAKEESSNMVVGDIDSSYYIDCPSEKTRYIYKSYQTTDTTSMLAECQFIADALKSTKEGWHIVAISHRWFQYTTSANPTVGNFPAYEKDILDVFDAYNNRQTRNGSNYFTAQDFTNCKGRVEFCIAGHIHVDHDVRTAGGIPVIITASDTNQERSSVEEEDCGIVGTITEQAVYGIIADYDNNKINVIGIGRGGSREVIIQE